MKKLFDFSHFKGDLMGGITAGIVALPLALAFGEQSGMGGGAGLYGAAFIAFFAALFGGTPTQISGPTAPMTALSVVVVSGMYAAFEGDKDAALPMILMIFILAGFIQILIGFLKLGTYIKFIPYTVVSGFMTGIGVIILVTQIPPMLGYYSGEDEVVVQRFEPQAQDVLFSRVLQGQAEKGILVLEDIGPVQANIDTITEEDYHREAHILARNDSKGVIGAIKYIPRAIETLEGSRWIEFALALITILIVYGFKKITTKIPSSLVAMLAVSLGAYFMELDYRQINEIPSGLPILHLEIFTDLKLGALMPFIQFAFLLALLGAIDSLLTSVVADNMTKTSHKPNVELRGQGIGNAIAGLFGGIPGAGATVRTVVNIQAGGKTRISGMIAGVLLFIIVLFLGPIASQIPAAVLAGILITVGIGVIDYKGLRALKRMEWPEKMILLTVLLLTVFWQLVYAVGVGLVMAALVFMKRMADNSAKNSNITRLTDLEEDEDVWPDELSVSPEIKDNVIFKHLEGPLFFGAVSHFRSKVSEYSNTAQLVCLRMERVPFIDQSGMYALEVAIEELQDQNVVVVISGLTEQGEELMRKMKIIPNEVPENHVFEDFDACKVWLQTVLTTPNGLERELELVKDKK